MYLPVLAVAAWALAAQEIPVSGTAVPSLAAFDQGMLGLLKQYDVPGGALAVMREGRLILARGYGWADVENKTPVQPDALFRLASVSKTVTAVGIMKLAEAGKLLLDRPVLEILDQVKPAPGETVTPAFRRVTVRHLLQHSGGWDRDRSPGGYDPMFQNGQVTRALGAPSPASCGDVIRWMLSRPLDNEPGRKYAYSNFGYCMLGRVIEKVSGKPYETFIREDVLAPMGISRMWIGASLPEGRRPGEVKYYDRPDAARVPSVFPAVAANVTAPYGAWDLRALDSHGGWIGSAIDIARLIKAIDIDLPGAKALKTESIGQMLARPAPPVAAAGDPAFYGFGMRVRPGPGHGNWWHTGSLPGTATEYVRDGRDRMAWVILLNRRAAGQFFADIDRLGWNALAKVSGYPSHDLFPRYAGAP